MQISNYLEEYVNNSIASYTNNIIITDLKEIKILKLTEIDKDRCSFGNLKLHDEVLSVIENLKMSFNDFIMINYNCIPLVIKDSNLYASQMIFPICHNNVLDGLLILFRTQGNYISSSAHSVEKFREFVTLYSDYNFRKD